MTTSGDSPDARPGGGGGPDAAPFMWKGSIGPTGGTMDNLSFAIVGDTRPSMEDDTAGYPTAIIDKIWADVEAESPLPPFAISTGDYMFASTSGNEAAPQMAVYMNAREQFENIIFGAMGNHECTGATASNCGQGNASGITKNFDVYRKNMLTPLGQTQPYYVWHINAKDGSWTAKFVMIAGNDWSNAEATWLDTALSEQTDYTFVIRHEPPSATDAPGVTPSETIIAKHPLTFEINGHTHTFSYSFTDKSVIVGNGGAPNTSAVTYGYVIAQRRTSDGAIVFSGKAYDTKNVFKSFAVYPDGTKAP